MLGTWQRLERVIKWTGFSVNSFALNIGLKRSENLYQIKRGNNGISRDLANLITSKYPSISKGWLLTGEGTMFTEPSEQIKGEPETGTPYFGMDILSAIDEDNQPDPLFRINIPIFNDCDIAALNIGTAMQPDIPAGSIVILKRWPSAALIPGETYLIVTHFFRGIRIVRMNEESTDQLDLVASNHIQYGSLSIQKNDILKLYIVRGVIIKKSL